MVEVRRTPRGRVVPGDHSAFRFAVLLQQGLTPQQYLEIRVEGATPGGCSSLAEEFLKEMNVPK